MKILGIDYGTARIGLAVSDPDERIASPLTVIKNENAMAKIMKIAEETGAGKIVVGIPSDSMGRDTKQSVRIREFARVLEEKTGIETVLFDENYSTRDAYDALKQMGYSMKKSKGKVDKIAASLFLTEYLEWKRNLNS